MPVQEDDAGTEGVCITCGFLSKWTSNVPGAPGCFEIDYTARFKGAAYTNLLADNEITTVPFCFRRVVSFEDRDEVGPKADRSLEEMEKATVAVFKRSRQCPKWYRYREGMAPQAHLEEMRMLEIEQRRDAHNEKMEQERRDWESGVEKERRKFEIFLAAVIGLLAVGEIAAGVAAIFF